MTYVNDVLLVANLDVVQDGVFGHLGQHDHVVHAMFALSMRHNPGQSPEQTEQRSEKPPGEVLTIAGAT